MTTRAHSPSMPSVPFSTTAADQLSLASLAHAARASLQWRMLLLWVVLMLIPTAIVVMPVWQTLSANLDHAVHAPALAQHLDMTAIADLMAAHGKSSSAFSNSAVLALIVTLLLSPLLSGMAVTAARSPRTLGFRALAGGALAEYPRMLRVLVWAAVPLGIALAVGAAASAAADKFAAGAIVAADASLPAALASVLTVLLLVLAHATLDAGRAALAIERRRSSAVKAWWSGCKILLRRPLATLGVYLAISLAGLGLAALLSVARLNLPGGGAASFIGALLLTQVIVAVIGAMRSARLFAMVALARSAPKA